MRLILVGGCERSGTSLVQKILVSHSRIAGGPEFVYTNAVADLHRRMAAPHAPHYEARLASFFDRPQLAEAFRDFYGAFFRRVFDRKPGAVFLSEKTPSNIFAASELLTIFPDALFVHVIRDGRDVLASHRGVRARLARARNRSHRMATFSPWRVCRRWNRAIDTHFRLTEDGALAGRYVALRYEDLLLEPARVLGGLFSFLGLDLEPRALTPEAIPAAETRMPVDGFWYTPDLEGLPFDPARAGRWRRDLPLALRLWATLLMAENLRDAGYEVGTVFLRVAPLLGVLTDVARMAGRRVSAPR